jgi:hypothetical protein
MFKARLFTLFTTLLTVSAAACSTNRVQPVVAASGAVACEGGIVRNDDDAARFDGCQAIVGDLRISHSDLIDVQDFRDLRQVSGKLVIEGNAKLVSLAGLKHVEHARSVEIRNNRVLAAFPALLPQLKHVDESVVLDANHGLSKSQVSALVSRVEVRAEQVTANLDPAFASRQN